MANVFNHWLLEEMQKRGLSNKELASRANISTSMISMILSGQRNPSYESCVSIAKALTLPPEYVFQQANIPFVNSSVEDDSKGKRAITLFNELNPEDKDHVLEYLEFLAERRRRQS